MNYADFVEDVKYFSGTQYEWLMLTQEKLDISTGGKLFSVEAIVFGGHLQAIVKQQECSAGWVEDTIEEMIKTIKTLGADCQKRRDRG